VKAVAAIEAGLSDPSKVSRIVKLTGYPAFGAAFTSQPDAIDGASGLCVASPVEAGCHARSAVGVAGLPPDVPI